ncbi:MAG: acyl--CoA ligase [Clostridia bacterium]|nr:acyl--CoA ligase [Clostridia bacterium]
MGILWSFIEKCLKSHPDSLIEEYNSEQYTYETMLHNIESHANVLKGHDLSQQKCVIICEKNIKCLEAMLFCWKVGMIPIPVSLHYGIEHCNKIISVTVPNYILVDTDELELETEIPVLPIEYFALHCSEEYEKDPELSDIELMMCTSGTTGLPKSSMFTGEAIETNTYAITHYFPLSDKERILIARPLYHCAVLVGEVLTALCVGANILFYSKKFNPLILSKLIKNDNITAMCGTPTLLKGVVDCTKDKTVLEKIHIIAMSGEYLLPEYAEYIAKYFSSAKIYNVYGLTEAGPRVAYLNHDLFRTHAQAVGKPIEGVEVKVSSCNAAYDDKVTPLPENEVGNVWVKTPCIMKGYYREKRMTEARMNGEWFNTGDLGCIRDGLLYIIGRSDDMIIKAGMNIYPREIEIKMLELPEIAEAMVYGDFVGGVEQIFSDIVIHGESSQITEQSIKTKLIDVIPGYMLPYKINIVEQLPRNASGKVVRPSKKIRETVTKGE